jgi:ubiquinone/menaquinone biosynthesis C-methylase UbiE
MIQHCRGRQVDDSRVRNEQRFWRKTAKKYDSWVRKAFNEQYKSFKIKLDRCIRSNDFVLEVGTGTGDIAIHIARRAKKVVGLDIAPEMIEIANYKKNKLKVENIVFKDGDAYNLPFTDGVFDKVVFCNSLQTMKEPIRAVVDAKRVLKDNGEIISITYCYGDTGLFEQIKLLKWVILYGVPVYWTNFTRVGLSGIFKNVGLKIVESEDVWNKPVILFLRCTK